LAGGRMNSGIYFGEFIKTHRNRVLQF